MFRLDIHHRLHGRIPPGWIPSGPISTGPISTGQEIDGDDHPIATDGASRHLLRGGPDVLLEWVETQIGHPARSVTTVERIVAHLACLERCELGHTRASFELDPLATATDLLRRRDALRLLGWQGNAAQDRDGLIADLSAIEASLDPGPSGAATLDAATLDAATLDAATLDPTALDPAVLDPRAGGLSERIDGVIAALDQGRRLPPHRVHLDEPPAKWPRQWQRLFRHLEIAAPSPTRARGRDASRLRVVQIRLGGATEDVALPSPDESLTVLRASSLHQACHTVAALLAADESRRARTAIICEDDHAAQLLDQTCAAYGLPTMGAEATSAARPALQVLPLTLELSWAPVDPQLLLDFLALPVGPVPRAAARRLSRALVERPGLGSDAWNTAWAESIDPERDPDGKVRTRLEEWLEFEGDGHPRGTALPASHVVACARRVHGWASRYAAALRNQPAGVGAEADSGASELARSLELAARQADLLARIAESREVADPGRALTELAVSTELTEPQLAHLLDEVQNAFISSHPLPVLAGAPRRFRDPAGVVDPTVQWIWLGVGTRRRGGSPWSPRDRVELARLGLDVDDGTQELRAQRRAERRAFAGIEERALFVEVPADDELRVHPLALAVRCEGDLETRAIDAIVGPDPTPEELASALAWGLEPRTVEPEPLAPRPTIWRVDPSLIPDRPFSSASELEARFACPLKWTFNYAAGLRASDSVELKRGVLLKGDFAHRILEIVFGREAPPLDETGAEESVRRVFRERLPLDAAPLAQPAATGERVALERELGRAARTLVRSLAAGGYRVVAMEEALRSQIDGRPLQGSIDCVVVDGSGREAIIDFKYGSAQKYRSFLAEGKAIQLATYAAGRAQGDDFPPVAYLILATGELFTPEGSALTGATAQQLVEGGPAVGEVWRSFTLALRASERWLESGEIPVRPLQSMESWPLGSNLALNAALAQQREQPVCRYCEFGQLCGLEAVR